MKSSSGRSLALVALAALLPFLLAGSSYAQVASAATVVPGGAHSSPKEGTVSAANLRVPDKAKRLLYEGQNQLRNGHDAKAKGYIDSALRIAPNYAEALTARGVIKLAEERPADALQDFNRAIRADRDNGLAYLGMGCALNQLYRFDDALPYLDRGSEFFPLSWQSAFETSRAWLAKHEYEIALQQVNRADSLSHSAKVSSGIHMVRGYSLLGLKRFEEASAELQAYLSAEPDGEVSTAVRDTLATLRALPTSEASPRDGLRRPDFAEKSTP
jgi:tetratricopeptide (TPR) repeat protein